MNSVTEKETEIFEDPEFLRSMNRIVPEGDGTRLNPYRISSFKNLIWISQNPGVWNSHLIQTADIDAKKTYYEKELYPWLPIGYTDTPFTGSYRGDGYTISNLYVTGERNTEYGLFGHIMNAEISGVRLDGVYVSVSGGLGIGGICGISASSSISDCNVRGVISGRQHVGGIAGICIRKHEPERLTEDIKKIRGSALASASKTTAVIDHPFLGDLAETCGFNKEKQPWYFLEDRERDIENCISDCKVIGGSIVGGITGQNRGTILKSTAIGRVTAFHHSAGGIAGLNDEDSILYSCFSYADIESFEAQDAGGLVSINSGFIISCCSIGDVYAECFSGGLVSGNLEAGIVYNSYSRGFVFDITRKLHSQITDEGIHFFGKKPGESKPRGWTSYQREIMEGYDLPYHYSNSGGLIAQNKGIVVNSYWENIDENEVEEEYSREYSYYRKNYQAGSGYVYSSKGGKGLKPEMIGRQDSFPGWDFSEVWIMGNVPGFKHECPLLRHNPGLADREYRCDRDYREYL